MPNNSDINNREDGERRNISGNQDSQNNTYIEINNEDDSNSNSNRRSFRDKLESLKFVNALMKNNVYMLIAVVAIIAIVSGSIFLYKYLANDRVNTTTTSYTLATKEIKKFYTGAYLIPLYDTKKGYLKRQAIDRIIGNPEKVVKGYCRRDFMVYVGYDNLDEILQDSTVINNIKRGDIYSLPKPKILAINGIKTSRLGDYTTEGACYQWDSNQQERERLIIEQLNRFEIYNTIVHNAQKSLNAIGSILYK